MSRVFRGKKLLVIFKPLHKIFAVRRNKISLSLIALFFITLIGFTLFQTLVSPPRAEAAWYNGGWKYRKSITIDYTKVAATLTDFPVVVNLSSDANLAGNAQSDGDDILFTSSDGSTKLSHEIEKFTSSTGELVAWVKVPSLSNSVNTVLYIYFGNASISSQQSATSVWDSSYKAVWHMKEDPSSTPPALKDSTTNLNTGLMNGSMTTSDQVSGKLNGAIDFDGTDDFFDVSLVAADMATGDITVSAWVNFTSTWNSTSGAGKTAEIFTNSDSPSNNDIRLRFLNNGTADFTAFQNGGARQATSTQASFTGGAWYFITGRFSTTDGLKLFINGTQDGSLNNTNARGATAATSSYIGQFWNQADGTPDRFPGVIDELRVSTTKRTDQWITTEYNNQNLPSTFYALGNAEGVTKTWYNYSWTCRKPITIDYTKVTGAQTEFPVLISLTSDAGLASGAQTDADDILFTYGGTKLSHEIEKYTSGTGELVAWVRVPYLSNTANTVIYMYYCNSSATNQQNAGGVWDSDYKGVWHLAQDPSGSAPQMVDSTSNLDHATTNGTMTLSDLVTGKSNGSLDFDNINDNVNLTTSLGITDATQLTVSAWVKDNGDTEDDWIMHKGNNRIIFFRDDVGFNSGRTDIFTFGITDAVGDSARVESATNSAAANTWYYVVGTFTGSSATGIRLYINGTEDANSPADATTVGNIGGLDSETLRLGSTEAGLGGFWNGIIDEARVSTAARSAWWIQTEYNNQNSPATFYNVGSAESSAASWYNNSWGARKRIKIDKSQVSGDQIDFPALISWTSDSDVAGLALSTGNDILFTDEDGTTKLSHEIEKYTTATGELVSWVKIPYLSSSVDTYIYMYYGNSGASNQQNAAGVWDSNYQAVWHLAENATTTYADSTSNARTIAKNSTTSPSQTGTQIGYGSQFTSGNSDRMLTTNLNGLTSVTDFTLGFWGRYETAQTVNRAMVSATDSGVNAAEISVDITSNTGNKIQIYTNNTLKFTTASTYFDTASWVYFTLTRNGSNLVLYKNGTATGDTATDSTALAITGCIAAGGSLSGSTCTWAGAYLTFRQDEFRFSTTARSSGWIQTEYNNQNSPSTFFTVAAQELNVPSSPTLIAPASGVTGLTLTPLFQFRSSEPNSDYARYEIMLYQSNCSTQVGSAIDQNSSQTGWSGQNAGPGSNTAYATSPTITSSTIANYTYQGSPALSWGTQYCWKARGKDPGGSNAFGPYSATQLFTTNYVATTPTLSQPTASATNVSLTPEFRFNTTDQDSDYIRYRLYLYQSDCSTAVGASPYTQPSGTPQTNWAGQGASNATAYNSGQEGIFQLPITLAANTIYCWKAEATDPAGTNTYSSASVTRTFTTRAAAPQNTRIDGNVRIEGGTRINP